MHRRLPGHRGTAAIRGKNGVVRITLPQRIGFYTLKLNFVFKGPQNNRLGEQDIDIPVWVSYDTPQIPNVKREWLKKAIQWTNFTKGPSQMAMAMMKNIYSQSRWKYIISFEFP